MSDSSDSDARSMIFDGKMFVSSRLSQAEEQKEVEDINVPWIDDTPAAAAGTKGSTPPKDPQLPKRIFQPNMKLYRKKVTLDPSCKWTFDRDKFVKDFDEHWEVLTKNQKIAYTHVLLFFEERTTHRETWKSRYGEWHHILPKSLGGSDNDENMIWLECGEFFVHMKCSIIILF